MSKRLYVIHKLPSPPTDEFLRGLHRAEDIELQVHHLWRTSGRRPWKQRLGEGYPCRYMQPVLGIDWPPLKQAWSDRESLFMVGDWAHVPTLAIVFARLLRRAPVALRVDTPQEQLKRPFLKRVPRAYFLRWLLRRVNLIFATGKPARRALTKMGANPEKIIDLQFVLDLERPARVRGNREVMDYAAELRHRVGCAEDGVVFVMAATIDLQKKAQDLGLEAFARVRAASDRPVGLLVAGAGDELEILKRRAAELDLGNSVAFLGWQEPDQIDGCYIAADVLLHPAHYDPFPIVIIEAMCFSRAVVGSDACGSVEERVRDGVNGYSFSAGNLDELVKGMTRLARDPEHLESVKKEARRTAESWPISRAVDIVRKGMERVLR